MSEPVNMEGTAGASRAEVDPELTGHEPTAEACVCVVDKYK